MRIKVFLTSAIFTYALAIYPAYAGGSDGALPTNNQEPEAGQIQNSTTQAYPNNPNQQVPVFDWKEWSKPYKTTRNLICREHHGNVICLTPTAAKKVNWQTR